MSTIEASAARWEPTPRWERRYREVLDAAAVVFAEKGYAGASTRDIADRLGIRQASLYYYLESKEAALAAICELGVKDFIANLQQIIRGDGTAAEKILAAVANHLAPLRGPPEAEYVCVFLRHRFELPDGARKRVATLARTYQNLVERLFREGVKAGQLRSDLDWHLATLAFLGLCNSVITNRGISRLSTVDAVIEEYARIITEGVGVKPARRSSRRQQPGRS